MDKPAWRRIYAQIDDQFLIHVFWTSIWLTVILVILLAVSLGTEHAFSFFVGAAISLVLLRTLEFTIRHFLVPGKKKASRSLFVIAHFKYLVVAVCFYFLVSSSWLRPGWLAVGIGIVQGVIFLKTLGILLNAWINRSDPSMDIPNLTPTERERQQ
ncbi:MAG: ATP synthase subunit I [Candidatus Latescibacteria bacterium]|nr:ATP synthase subunit I [Candidatus Latescibacterota bacterium]